MTIKMRLQHIIQAASFVNTNYCSKERGERWGQAKMDQCKTWYKRVASYALAEAERQPKKLYSVSLYEAWDFAVKDFVEFAQELKVGAPTG